MKLSGHFKTRGYQKVARHWATSASFLTFQSPFSCSGCLVWIQAHSDPPCPSHFLLHTSWHFSFCFFFQGQSWGDTPERQRVIYFSFIKVISLFPPSWLVCQENGHSHNGLQLTFMTQGSTSRVRSRAGSAGCRHSLISGGRTISSNIDDDKSREWLLFTVVSWSLFRQALLPYLVGALISHSMNCYTKLSQRFISIPGYFSSLYLLSCLLFVWVYHRISPLVWGACKESWTNL